MNTLDQVRAMRKVTPTIRIRIPRRVLTWSLGGVAVASSLIAALVCARGS
jgi:hypothetical protein